MTDLFTEKDFVDEGGYHKRASWLCDMVNERMKALTIERSSEMILELGAVAYP